MSTEDPHQPQQPLAASRRHADAVKLILLWGIASAIGGAIGVYGFFAFFAVLFASGLGGGIPDFVPYVVLSGAAIVFGGGLGLSQWLVLRLHIPNSGKWILASIIGGVVGVVVGLFVFFVSSLIVRTGAALILATSLFGAAVGGGVGLAQWFILGPITLNAGKWIAANTLGFALSSALVAVLFRIAGVPVNSTPLVLVVSAGSFLLYGLVTGAVLVRLLRTI